MNMKKKMTIYLIWCAIVVNALCLALGLYLIIYGTIKAKELDLQKMVAELASEKITRANSTCPQRKQKRICLQSNFLRDTLTWSRLRVISKNQPVFFFLRQPQYR
jgi:hypothetical protein